MCPFLDYFTSFRRRAKMYKDIRKCWNIFFFFTKFKLLNLWPKLSYLKTKAEYLFTWWRGTLNIHSEQNKIILTLRVAWWNCKLIFFGGGGYSQLFVVISCLFREFLSPAILIFVEISEIKNLLFHMFCMFMFSANGTNGADRMSHLLFIYLYTCICMCIVAIQMLLA